MRSASASGIARLRPFPCLFWLSGWVNRRIIKISLLVIPDFSGDSKRILVFLHFARVTCFQSYFRKRIHCSSSLQTVRNYIVHSLSSRVRFLASKPPIYSCNQSKSLSLLCRPSANHHVHNQPFPAATFLPKIKSPNAIKAQPTKRRSQ